MKSKFLKWGGIKTFKWNSGWVLLLNQDMQKVDLCFFTLWHLKSWSTLHILILGSPVRKEGPHSFSRTTGTERKLRTKNCVKDLQDVMAMHVSSSPASIPRIHIAPKWGQFCLKQITHEAFRLNVNSEIRRDIPEASARVLHSNTGPTRISPLVT